ncbi:MAG: hypothetical protein A2508_01990 [Candidatus Lambdaproteobacteria bacterium RIFOXYD12_FULL_49_8]|nr:MAG: hypothetical protein A2508_01990 [Candidatus Lambdaproteobacteria bacterium RIFOXYD12_FULL_49_8]
MNCQGWGALCLSNNPWGIGLKLGYLLFFVFSFLCGSNLLADEAMHDRLSVRALGMGNAFVAVGGDEGALFYNPAGLKSIKAGLLQFFTAELHASNTVIDAAKASDIQSILSDIAGKKAYAEINADLFSASGPGWAWSYSKGGFLDLKIDNPVIPYVTLRAYLQTLAAGGLAFDFNEKVTWGLTVKKITRQGITQEVHIVDLAEDTFISSLQDQLVSVSAQGYDLGFLYRLDKELGFLSTPRVGLVFKNIGGMDFGATGKLEQSYDLGFAWDAALFELPAILAIDWLDVSNQRHQAPSYWRNVNLGSEISWGTQANGKPIVAYRLGMKGPYMSWGFTLNPSYLPITLEYASWSQEIGDRAGDVADKRQSMILSFNW